MKLSSELVGMVARTIEASGAVPLPGGHGVWFSEIRQRYPELCGSPGTAARCYVCLGLLGDGDGEQRWNPKEWWPHALAWFDIYCPSVAEKLNGPRWAYLLSAMLKVFNDWAGERSEFHHLLIFAKDSHRRAESRLTPITQKGQGAIALSHPASDLPKAADSDEAWHYAAEALSAAESPVLELCHFLNVLHTSLGLAQHSLDEKYSSRLAFYGQLADILENGSGLPKGLHEPAARIAGALKSTVLLGGAVRLDAGARLSRLPSCFKLAHYRGRPPARGMVEWRLQQEPDTRDRVLAAHDLAVAVADMAMDFFRSGCPSGPAFRPSAYDYLHSLIRYGPKMLQAATGEDAQIDHPPSDLIGTLPSRPMTRAVAERMRSGLLADPAREMLKTHLRNKPPRGGQIF